MPRTLGELDGEPVTAQNGRYGPYVKKGSESRSLESEEQMFTVTLDEAKELLAQPKPRGRAATRRGGAAAERAGRGLRPAASRSCCREGRSGPYVTDGETNASLRKGDLSSRSRPQRAIELLAERQVGRARAAAARPRSGPDPAGGGEAGGGETADREAGGGETAAAKSAAAKSATAKPRATKPAAGSGGHALARRLLTAAQHDAVPSSSASSARRLVRQISEA